MKLILRDDDLSYFTDPGYLEFLYRDVWSKIKIHFAVIPMVYSNQKETPFWINHEKDYYPIYENKNLVEFLKKLKNEGRAGIWQHGYNHKNLDNGFELEDTNYGRVYRNLKQGKSILEDTFETSIDTLIAPHDRFSRQSILAAEKIGYCCIGRAYAPKLRELRVMDSNTRISGLQFFQHWRKHKKKLRYPGSLQFGKHTEVFFYRVEELLSFSRSRIEYLLEFHKNGILAITTHYRSFNLQKKELLLHLVDKVRPDKPIHDGIL